MIYCINLPRAIERRLAVEEQFQRVSSRLADKVRFVHAAVPDVNVFRDAADQTLDYPARGMIGCTLSHLQCLTDALHVGGPQGTVVFEDDVVLEHYGWSRAVHAIASIPAEWDIFYLGGQPMDYVKKINDAVGTGSRFFGAYAYVVHPRALRRVVKNAIDKLTVTSFDAVIGMNDDFVKYCLLQPIARTAPGYSYIMDQQADWQIGIDEHWARFSP